MLLFYRNYLSYHTTSNAIATGVIASFILIRTMLMVSPIVILESFMTQAHPMVLIATTAFICYVYGDVEKQEQHHG